MNVSRYQRHGCPSHRASNNRIRVVWCWQSSTCQHPCPAQTCPNSWARQPSIPRSLNSSSTGFLGSADRVMVRESASRPPRFQPSRIPATWYTRYEHVESATVSANAVKRARFYTRLVPLSRSIRRGGASSSKANGLHIHSRKSPHSEMHPPPSVGQVVCK